MTQEQLVYYAKKLQEEWSLEQLIEKVFLNNNEVGSPTTQLDENGLMPCGCGGKAHVYMPVSVYSLYIIGCERCRVRITFPNKVNEAKNEWNAAMGWKGGAE